MKKFYYLPLALAALAFSACSSDDGVTADQSNDLSQLLANGGYMKVAVKLPTQTDTKAANDNFSDGLTSEYEVKDAILLLFNGTTSNEDAATFIGAYDLTPQPSYSSPDYNQITSTVKVISTSTYGSTQDVLGLVVLNANGLFSKGDNNVLNISSVAGGGTATTWNSSSNKTFKDLKELVAKSTTVAAMTTTGFYMVNAPLANVQGGTVSSAPATTTTTVNTLVSFKDKIYDTMAKAEENPAATIYVERGMAKVTMSSDDEDTYTLKNYDQTETTKKVTAAITGWALDITNTTSYLLHNYSTAWNSITSDLYTTANYRFLGQTNMSDVSTAGSTGLFRTYWATDPNYDNTQSTSDFKTITSSDLVTKYGNENPLYCFENTFDVPDQKQDRTTRVIVGVKLTPGSAITKGTISDGDFYTTDYNVGSDYSFYAALSDLDGQIKKAIQNNTTVVTDNRGAVESTNIAYTTTTSTTTGIVSIATITINNNAGTTSTKTYSSEDADNSVVKDINSTLNIKKFTGGKCYYPIRIKHFGDDLTPWNSVPASETAINSTDIYGLGTENANLTTATNRYLGRYGVLRNNWYDITVNSISEVGSPVIPTPDDSKYDDELENYLTFSINILSWAKRTQAADL